MEPLHAFAGLGHESPLVPAPPGASTSAGRAMMDRGVASWEGHLLTGRGEKEAS